MSFDRFFLQLYSYEIDLANYGVAFKFGSLALIFNQVLILTLTPYTRKIYVEEKKMSEQIFNVSIFVYSVLAVSFAMVVSISAGPLMQLFFSDKFPLSDILFPLLAISFVINGFVRFLIIGSWVEFRSWDIIFAGASSAVANIVLTPIFFALWGVVGACVATVIASAVYCVVAMCLCIRGVPFRFEYSYILVVLFCLVCFTLFFAFQNISISKNLVIISCEIAVIFSTYYYWRRSTFRLR